MSQDSDPHSLTSSEAREAYLAELKKTIKDKHHLLWCRSEWSNGSAHSLRQNPYLGVNILMDFHHDDIHHELRNIPVPAEHLCLAALSRIQSGLISGELDPIKDPPYFRLGILIDLWEIQAKDTTAVLIKQQELFKDYHDDVIAPVCCTL